MNESKLTSKFANATKWATITEFVSKMISPLTNMVLARILAPEAFGVVATIALITSFAEIFTDAGFQKYLIQHNFKDKEEKNKSANVAFITNLIISIVLWGIITLSSNQLVQLLGNSELDIVIIVACLQLPLYAFSSIQMALYKREFDFKSLFIIRMFTIAIPVIVTIPLALLGMGYWALVIGNLAGQFVNVIILTYKSKWKPRWYFNFDLLKKMFSFSIWTLIESISIWLTVWIDSFIIASALNNYFLGIYKTSTTMVNTLMALITASIVPVLFSALSRLQEDEEKFNSMFFNVQRIVAILVLPLGIGVYLYSDLATKIMLGSQWAEASDVIGTWALTSALVIVLSHFCSEVYRAKGKPKLSFFAQILHLVILVPVCIYSAKFGFWALVYARSWVRLQGTIVHFILMKFALGFPIFHSLRNVFVPFIAAVCMGGVGLLLRQVSNSMIWTVISIVLCVLFYFALIYISPTMRKDIKGLIKQVTNKSI